MALAHIGINVMSMKDVERRLLSGGATYIEPIAVRLPQAIQISGFSRSEIYRRAARGEITLLKCGSSTLVDMASLRGAVAGLPRANIRRSQAA